jgi:peptide/nickel transport system ATP-binding protein
MTMTGEPALQPPSVLPPQETSLLEVRDLRVCFDTESGPVRAVDGVSFTVERGEVVAIVGQSGSGKSITALTVMGLTRRLGARLSGAATFEGHDLLGASEAQLRRLRGARMAMVFQDPLSSLNPVQRVGQQIAEQIRAHQPLVSRREAIERAAELMDRVGIRRVGSGLDGPVSHPGAPSELAQSDPPNAASFHRAYPHQLSGGMRQRVMIAMALSCDPGLLIADEPTTALDVSTQAQILALLRELRERSDTAILLVTHDLGVVAGLAQRILVMHSGTIVEQGSAQEILSAPQHPYTQSLLAAHTARPTRVPRPPGAPLLRAQQLTVRFPHKTASVRPFALSIPGRSSQRSSHLHALDGVSLTLGEGETLGVVGESGAGKTTLIRCLMRLMDPASGAIHFRDTDITHASRRQLAPVRRQLQMVFQDAHASLNPRRRVESILASGLRLRGVPSEQLRTHADELLGRVGLDTQHLDRYPHELSGGQRQRVGIARALSSQPRAIVLDEPVSALDAPIRAQVLDLLVRLQDETGVSYLLVAHDLAVVRDVCDRIAVMHRGRVVEIATAAQLFRAPAHPYTRELLAASQRPLGGVRSTA